ncbi:STAS domain-containing protein [Geodermatophilus normandii]|uniref:STAS domain-containing protein n=1 Tax=Geodermatophilus normandii TaxID=1137989 RepID=A0A6P0GM26_9ACTN|nr:STAS domain-containing protein [Geodermatophilus normandii]NEM08433.1 STAS domain-containing protein [Geodermatophilus normandii]
MSAPVQQQDVGAPTLLDTRRLRADDGVVRLVVRGEVDLSTVDALEAAVSGAWRPRPAVVVVDLTRVTFCCVAGAGVLIAARSAAAAQGVEVRLLTRQGTLRRVLHLVDELELGHG